MFEVLNARGNTYYYEAYTNVGIYRLGSSVILIDACDHPRMVRGVDRYLTEQGLTVDTIIDTHCHVDHICGNRFFQDKYSCRLLSSKQEQGFISYPDREPAFYYAGIDTEKSKNPFFLIEPSDTEVITEENTPEGFEIISLPGHSFGMIGVRTPDDVVFLADAVLSKKTWEEYKMPFFYDVNKAIETLEGLKELRASLFIPSHNPPVEDITGLCDYNIEKLQEKKALVLSLCEGRSFDELFKAVIEKQQLKIRTEKYPMYSLMLRNLLQSLVEDGKICGVLEGNMYIYRCR